MTAVLLTQPRIRFLDSNGAPLAGGKIYTYTAGTTTPLATYTTAAGNVPNANPVILDSAGYADIWISGAYKIVVHDSADSLISSTDNITAFTTGAVGATFLDGSLTVQNTSDTTKQAVFNLAGITTGTTVTMTVPNANFTIPAPSLPQTWTAAQREAIVTLTDSATITPDFSLGNNYQVQLGGNRTIANPTNIVAGQSGNIAIYQDATGSRTPSWNWGWINPGSSLPTLQSAGGSVDLLKYTVAAYNSGVVTISIATPGVVTFTNHGFELGQQIQISTTGALPTGLSTATTYYVVSIDANSFSLATSLANAAAGTKINTTGTQSGIHTLTGVSIVLTLPKAATASGGYRALSGSDTVVSADNGKILQVAGTCALALTAAATVGAFSCYLENTATSGIQIITITPNGTDNIDGSNSTLIMLPGETRLLTCNATAWTTVVVTPFKINLTSTASPTLPRNGYQGMTGQLWGGGGSGGAGATDGGGGGGGGAFGQFTLMSGTLSVASLALTCTIGAGGLSQTTANTAGNTGGTTTVVTGSSLQLHQAYGGGGGGGGSLGAGGGGGSIGSFAAGSTGNSVGNGGVPTVTGVGASAVTTTFGIGAAGFYSGTGSGAGLSGGPDAGGCGGNATTNPGGGGYYGGAGGGVSKATTGAVGGNSMYGGGGGGGASNITGGAGGFSVNGGAGGAGGSNGAGTGGAVGGGGGGGAVGTAGSGAGGGGRIILVGMC